MVQWCVDLEVEDRSQLVRIQELVYPHRSWHLPFDRHDPTAALSPAYAGTDYDDDKRNNSPEHLAGDCDNVLHAGRVSTSTLLHLLWNCLYRLSFGFS